MDKNTTRYKITAIKVIDGHRSAAGNKLLATFDLKAAGIRVNGCLLILNAKGLVTCHGPSGKTRQGNEISAEFIRPEVHREVTRLAAKAYTAMTGREVSDE